MKNILCILTAGMVGMGLSGCVSWQEYVEQEGKNSALREHIAKNLERIEKLLSDQSESCKPEYQKGFGDGVKAQREADNKLIEALKR